MRARRPARGRRPGLRARALLHAAAMVASLGLTGCETLLGSERDPAEVLDVPIDGLTGGQLESFHAGARAFAVPYAADGGLGPVFNAPSCDSCHPRGGRGHPAFNLIRFGRGDAGDAITFDHLEQLGGPQLQDHAIAGYAAEVLPSDVASSPRGGPIVAGVGLLELVPAETIVALADPADGDGDGISGRANYVTPPEFIDLPEDCVCAGCRLTATGCTVLGRFGRKAATVNLLHQAATAFHANIGITSELFPTDVFNPQLGVPSGDAFADPEVATATLHNVVLFLQTLRPPWRRDSGHPDALAGQKLFHAVGCAKCHVPALPTGDSDIAALRFRTAHAYTDMLLHDMGTALADGYPEGEATGREWRTTPLWGLRLVAKQLGGIEYYLHDGRANSLSEAIEHHGGEAQAAADAFEALSNNEQHLLLSFLRSL